MYIPGNAGDIELERTMFKASIVEVVKRYGQKVKRLRRPSS